MTLLTLFGDSSTQYIKNFAVTVPIIPHVTKTQQKTKIYHATTALAILRNAQYYQTYSASIIGKIQRTTARHYVIIETATPKFAKVLNLVYDYIATVIARKQDIEVKKLLFIANPVKLVRRNIATIRNYSVTSIPHVKRTDLKYYIIELNSNNHFIRLFKLVYFAVAKSIVYKQAAWTKTKLSLVATTIKLVKRTVAKSFNIDETVTNHSRHALLKYILGLSTTDQFISRNYTKKLSNAPNLIKTLIRTASRAFAVHGTASEFVQRLTSRNYTIATAPIPNYYLPSLIKNFVASVYISATLVKFISKSFDRTNYIRNNSMQGTIIGFPGSIPDWVIPYLAGLQQQIIGHSVEGGIDYVDISFYGIPNISTTIYIEPEVTTPANNQQTWTFSPYVKVEYGSLTNTQISIEVDEE
jgi:hypothetical protein